MELELRLNKLAGALTSLRPGAVLEPTAILPSLTLFRLGMAALSKQGQYRLTFASLRRATELNSAMDGSVREH